MSRWVYLIYFIIRVHANRIGVLVQQEQSRAFDTTSSSGKYQDLDFDHCWLGFNYQVANKSFKDPSLAFKALDKQTMMKGEAKI
ncbi:hypothetical protein LguiA_018169 [Lonicera macranthoides]